MDFTEHFLSHYNHLRWFVKNVRVEGFNLKITIDGEILRKMNEYNEFINIAKVFSKCFLHTKEGTVKPSKTKVEFARISGYGLKIIFSHRLDKEFNPKEISNQLSKKLN